MKVEMVKQIILLNYWNIWHDIECQKVTQENFFDNLLQFYIFYKKNYIFFTIFTIFDFLGTIVDNFDIYE